MKNLRELKWLMLFTAFILLSACNNQQPAAQADDEFKVVHPSWSEDVVLYEVNVRQFSEEGSFNGVEVKLDDLAELGVDVLWLMPVHPIGEMNRKGELGSYYSVRDYMDVNPEFGTLEDFRSLVNSAHEKGMYVILDWVPNHSSWDNRIATEHPGWYDHDSAGNFVAPYDWTDVIKFNWEQEGLQNYMLEALKFWVEEYDIDGYRVDHPHNTPEAFWAKARKELDQIRPVLMLAENEDQVYFLKEGFDMNYSWAFHHTMNQVAKLEEKPEKLNSMLMEEKKVFPKSVYRLRFITNHDENSWAGTVAERMGDSEKAFATLMFTIPGVPLLYNGQEIGLNKRLLFFERDPIEWFDSDLREFYKTLIALKKDNPALHNGEAGGDFNIVKAPDSDNVYAYSRTKEENVVLTMINFSPESVTFSIDDETIAGDYTNLFNNESESVSSQVMFELGPWGFEVFSKK